MGIFDQAKAAEMEKIAALTNPANKELRKVVEDTDPSDVDLTTLARVASDLRASKSAVKSIVGED